MRCQEVSTGHKQVIKTILKHQKALKHKGEIKDILTRQKLDFQKI